METMQSTRDPISDCAKLLIELGLSLAFAESATCGYIGSAFSMADDAGKFLKGGISCYDAVIKESLLSVDPALIEIYTPESAEVTEAIAKGIKPLFRADILIGCTGLTCAGGSETEEKPVGTMFIHGIHNEETIFSDRTVFTGSQQEIVNMVTARTANLLLAYLKSYKEIQTEKAKHKNGPANGIDGWSVSWP